MCGWVSLWSLHASTSQGCGSRCAHAKLPQLFESTPVAPAGRGLYRFAEIPPTERDPYIEAVLWGGEGALLSHDAVLALHQLGDEVLAGLRAYIAQYQQR